MLTTREKLILERLGIISTKYISNGSASASNVRAEVIKLMRDIENESSGLLETPVMEKYTFEDFTNDFMGIHAIVSTARIRAIWDKIYQQGYMAGKKGSIEGEVQTPKNER